MWNGKKMEKEVKGTILNLYQKLFTEKDFWLLAYLHLRPDLSYRKKKPMWFYSKNNSNKKPDYKVHWTLL